MYSCRRDMCHGTRRLLYHNRHMSYCRSIILRGVHPPHRKTVTRSVRALSSVFDDSVNDLLLSLYSPTFDQVADCYLTMNQVYPR